MGEPTFQAAADYDTASDVLYLTFAKGAPAEEIVEDKTWPHVLWRYADRERTSLVGVTIVDVSKMPDYLGRRWLAEHDHAG